MVTQSIFPFNSLSASIFVQLVSPPVMAIPFWLFVDFAFWFVESIGRINHELRLAFGNCASEENSVTKQRLKVGNPSSFRMHCYYMATFQAVSRKKKKTNCFFSPLLKIFVMSPLCHVLYDNLVGVLYYQCQWIN